MQTSLTVGGGLGVFKFKKVEKWKPTLCSVLSSLLLTSKGMATYQEKH